MDHASVPTRRFSYDLLKEITDGFSEERLIGSGGYGSVYKGVHKDGKTIAVKLLYNMQGFNDVQFKREVDNLTSLQHNNIVRLVGYCHETRPECVEYQGKMVVADRIHRALCFEYARNGSLHDNLFDEYNGHDWRTRFEIIKGICNGLKYLHELKPSMYHLDLKPGNVLLDENMLPKIADFGLSRLFGQEQTLITINSIGTCGYIPPEFIEKHMISNKFDIFSLGVVIIKVMAGPEGHSKCFDMSSREFVKLVHRNWRDRIKGTSMYELEPYYEQVKTCIEIALRCVETDRHKRPSMMDIVDRMNESETKIQLRISKQAQSVASAITSLSRFEYSDLAGMTNRFSEDSQLDHGYFERVFKGSYTDENGKQEVAVKKFDYTENFLAELQIISVTRHMNVVELKGWSCSQNKLNLINFMGWFRSPKDKFFLVYELMPNGNLGDHLHKCEKILSWERRYQIVKGIGSALCYLHHKCYPPILHRHINPSNVLLDHDFNPKLAGFGLSIIASQNNETFLTYVIETMGYMDPEIMKDGEVEFDRKSDVYSFGIVLLEITCTNKSREQVWELYRRSAAGTKVMEAADPKLCGVFNRMEMERVIVLGLRCSHPDRKQRPYMVDVMKFLEDGIELNAVTELEGQQGASAITDIEDGIKLPAKTETDGQRGPSAVTEIEEIEEGMEQYKL